MVEVRVWLDGFESTSVARRAPGELSFGRVADFVVDPSNQHLHRVLGRVSSSERGWRLGNDERSIIDLKVAKPMRARPVSVAPDSSTYLPLGQSIVRFNAGRSTYCLCIEVTGSNDDGTDLSREDPEGPHTLFPGADVAPTPGQLRVLVAMCEPTMQGVESAGASKIPTNKELSNRLNISAKTVEKHLAELYDQFADAGVTALRASSTASNADRRRLLVRSALLAEIVTATESSHDSP